VQSDGPGCGCSFRVRLPRDVRSALGTALDARENRPRHRVLVVDDNRDAAASLARLLELLGHEVHIAHDGFEALALAASRRPRVVLLDVELPKLDGYEVARHLRRAPGGSDVFLAALTGWTDEAHHERTKEASFDRHLTKPLDPGTLAELLAHLPAAPG
jgi:CheY-like chemotaxis protein